MKHLLLCIAVLSMTTIAYAQDKLTPGPGEVELTYVGKGTQLGVWNPTTKVYTIPIKYKEGPLAGQYRSLTFTEDGKVLNGEGTEVGSKQPDGSWKTAQMEKVFRSSYNVFWKTEIVGTILETMVSIHGLPMVQTSSTMDQDVLTFLVFCNHYAGRLDKIKEEVKKDNDKKAAEAKRRQEEEAAKNPQSPKKVGFDKSSCSFTTMKGKTFNLYGKVKLVEYDHQADIKVLLVKYDHQADIKVKLEEFDHQANSCGRVKLVEYDHQADVKVKLVEYDHQADIKVLLVEHDHQAGLR